MFTMEQPNLTYHNLVRQFLFNYTPDSVYRTFSLSFQPVTKESYLGEKFTSFDLLMSKNFILTKCRHCFVKVYIKRTAEVGMTARTPAHIVFLQKDPAKKFSNPICLPCVITILRKKFTELDSKKRVLHPPKTEILQESDPMETIPTDEQFIYNLALTEEELAALEALRKENDEDQEWRNILKNILNIENEGKKDA